MKYTKVDSVTAYSIDKEGRGVIYSTAYDLDRVSDKVAQEYIGFPIDSGNWQPATKSEFTKAGISHNHKAMKLVFDVSEEAVEDWKASR